MAQDDEAADESQAIVITGSRIQRRDYEANSPTVTVDEKFLQSSSTAAIEQQLNKLPQFVVSQSSTVKNNEGGLVPAGGDIQPNSTNTPGAATVSLRGVGANRTLVLIDGRRGTPGNASGTVDISTIPSSAIQRVEIVSGGASATYGADAVAGVTNFILKKNFQGVELNGQMGISQYGDGFEYQISGIMGTDFADGRGNVSLALSTNTREVSYERNRPWYRDRWDDPNVGGNAFFISRPGIALQTYNPGTVASLFPGADPALPAAPTGTIYANGDGSLWLGDSFANRGAAGFFKPWAEYDAFNDYKLTSVGTLATNITNNYLSVPLTRYNAFARGNYEVNDWIGIFGQAMFAHTSTYTRQAPGNITSGWDADIPWGSGVYLGNAAVPASVIRNGETFGFVPYDDPTPGILTDNPTNPAFAAIYGGANPILACATNPFGGCTNTQAFENVLPEDIKTLLNNRTVDIFSNPQGANGRVPLRAQFPDPRETFTDVMTYNLVAGLEGSIPGTDWTWDVSVNHGVSQTSSRQTGIYSLARTRAVVTAPNFGQGFRYTGNQESSQPGFGASTGQCTTGFDFFNVMGSATSVSSDCRQAIRADLNNKGTMQQTIVEANLQGGLFDLPAGQLRGAIGASYRKQSYTFINDGLLEKDRSFLDQAIGIYPSGDTVGSISTRELYAELLIPVVRDLPLVQEFNLEVGGRMSDYNTTGTSYTYKILGDWKVTDWLRLRGGFNRAERAPNIAELFLSPQQTFGFDTVGDLCSTMLAHPSSANPTSNPSGAADVRSVCEALMVRDNGGTVPTDANADGYPDFAFYTTFAAFQPTGPGFSFGSVAGNAKYRETIDPNIDPLKPEKANTWTLGAVIQSPFTAGPLSRLQFSVDYFNIKISDPIGSLSVGAAQQLCLDPTYNPDVVGAGTDGYAGAQAQEAISNPACGFVKRNPNSGFGGGLNSAAMVTTYRNDGEVRLSGIDVQGNWSYPVGPGTLMASAQYSYMFEFKAKELNPNPLYNYVGTQGTGVKGLNFGSSFTWRLFTTLGYSIGGANLSLQWQHNPPVDDSIFPNQNTGVPAYDMFNLNGSYQFNRDISFRFGIDNLLNTRPLISGINVAADASQGQLPGGSFSFFSDTQGRRFSLGATVKF